MSIHDTLQTNEALLRMRIPLSMTLSCPSEPVAHSAVDCLYIAVTLVLPILSERQQLLCI